MKRRNTASHVLDFIWNPVEEETDQEEPTEEEDVSEVEDNTEQDQDHASAAES